ncbi:MAG: CYTH domain-containing protein [Ruminococcus sp.]|nr:CYTH domain-containing protein [Ruminococcus sp.]
MEIERKFLIKRENLPENLEQYPSKVIEQGYLCTEPVVRIRKSNDNYYLTYKSKGLLAREEYNLPLTKEAYEHLKPKADGIVISKVRYVIPEKDGLSIELDVFKAPYEGLLLAEVEFPTEEAAHAYQPPKWFGEDVACLKNHSRNLHAPLCGIFCPNSVAVARYGALIRAKSPTNRDAHLAESLFQTRSKQRPT